MLFFRVFLYDVLNLFIFHHKQSSFNCDVFIYHFIIFFHCLTGNLICLSGCRFSEKPEIRKCDHFIHIVNFACVFKITTIGGGGGNVIGLCPMFIMLIPYPIYRGSYTSDHFI